MARDAFISYSKKDKAIADAICAALENEGLTCWYAPRDVEVGGDWDASIMEALANSRVMILVWSANSDTSKQVKRELAIALDDLGVSLIPFRTEITEHSKLRYYLGNIQWLDASTPPLEKNLPLLIQEVRASIARINHLDESDQKEVGVPEDAAAEIREVLPTEHAAEETRLEAEESAKLAEAAGAEEEERQRVGEEQKKAEEAERRRAESEARELAEAEARRTEEEARERAEEEARIRAIEEAELLAQKKRAEEAERRRLQEQQRKADELERQRVEAETRKRKEAEARKREEAEARQRDEAEAAIGAAALTNLESKGGEDQSATSREMTERSQSAPTEPSRPDAVSILNSYESTTSQRFPVRKVAIPVAALLLAIGLAYAFWPVKHDEPNQPATAAVASSTPTPEMTTSLSSPSKENKGEPLPKASPTPRKSATPERSPSQVATEHASERPFGRSPVEAHTDPPPPPKPTPTPPRAPISGGVFNGKAIYLPKPAYPPIARQARASGTVVVQITIDENGSVISAHAVSGHPLLQAAAVAAARQARFSPAKLSGQPVKVNAVLTYNFVPQ
jgi:TonB family protein